MLKRLLTGLCAVVCAACGPSVTQRPDGAVSCGVGDTPHCEGTAWTVCKDGWWQSEECAPAEVCAPDLGCRACQPGLGYCVGQEAWVCNAEGTGGSYAETCGDQEQCISGACLGPCEEARQTRSNVGCEFWAVDLPNEYYCQSLDGGATCNALGPMSYGCAACQQFSVAIANTSDLEVTVKVEQNDAAPGEAPSLSTVRELAVAAQSLAQIDLPMREVDCTTWYTDATGKMRRTGDSVTCLSSRAYRITTSYPVVAYQFNPIENDFSNGASLLLPTNALDLSYYAMSWSTANPILIELPGGPKMEGIPDHMNVTIVGVTPGTTVQVTPTQPTTANPDGTLPATPAGGTLTATLGPFDVLNVSSFQDMQHPTGDFTGTKIVATAPVAVFSGGQRSVVPGKDITTYSPRPPEPTGEYDVCCTEHFEQQMFPISSLGKKFVVTRTPPRSTSAIVEPDFYRILATAPTTVETTLTQFPSFTVTAGQVVDFWATEDFVLTAGEPVMIAQYAVCQGFIDAGGTGDPEFIQFAPVEQFRGEYIFLTPPTFTKDYVILAAPDGALVRLDGTNVNDEFNALCTRHPAGLLDGVQYYAIRCPVADGVHRIESSKPVGIIAYGYYAVGSYGYPGGADVKQINVQ